MTESREVAELSPRHDLEVPNEVALYRSWCLERLGTRSAPRGRRRRRAPAPGRPQIEENALDLTIAGWLSCPSVETPEDLEGSEESCPAAVDVRLVAGAAHLVRCDLRRRTIANDNPHVLSGGGPTHLLTAASHLLDWLVVRASYDDARHLDPELSPFLWRLAAGAAKSEVNNGAVVDALATVVNSLSRKDDP